VAVVDMEVVVVVLVGIKLIRFKFQKVHLTQ
jgi:hypothetical protein